MRNDGATILATRSGLPVSMGVLWRTRAALAGCVSVLAAAAWRSVLPGSESYTRGSAPPWVTAVGALLAAVAVLLAMGWPRAGLVPRRGVLAVGWFGCVLLIWSAGLIVFDVLRAAAVLGIPGLPPVVDWPGMVVRTVALGAAVLVAVTLVAYRRRSGSGCLACGRDPAARAMDGKWLGYAACALTLPYPLLKVYWSLGGTVARSAVTASEMFPVGEIIIFAATAVLALALVQGWGRVFPRWMLVVCGWAATVPLVIMGALAGFGTLAQGLGLVDGPVRFDHGAWIVSVVYGSWLLLGLALGSATLGHQRRRRPPCARCDLR